MGRYNQSLSMLERALEVIPLASQTFSKSVTQFPEGVSPHFIVRGDGSRVWDIDGNEYIDFVNGLAAVTLGYNDPDVTEAVERQLRDGVTFSLAHPLEVGVAERIVEMVPSAEMVRFGKNGSDATTGAIRLARAFTGRDEIALCGYHGWHDWYIGTTTRHLGVPASTRALSHTFAYNDLDSLEAILEERDSLVAAVILEPMNIEYPDDGFLAGVRDLAHEHGALLIFDETITGFRFSTGGAQELFGVYPDLSTFGKGLANGFPVSAVVGRKDVMKLMEDVFYSFTFGGEALSLAAAAAVLDKIKREPVLETIAVRGSHVVDRVRQSIVDHGLAGTVSISGHPSWSILAFDDVESYTSFDLKTLFLQEMFARGILIIGSHNMSYAHTDADVDVLIAAYNDVLGTIRDAIVAGDLTQRLRCDPLVPLFSVR